MLGAIGFVVVLALVAWPVGPTCGSVLQPRETLIFTVEEERPFLETPCTRALGRRQTAALVIGSLSTVAVAAGALVAEAE